ncbi:elongation of very long chain fatty acids protein 4-like [Varroa jacobsoni]|uniref:Elongation of very long chain fatty acids protein n=1 Tax=Varroa destructor TaxID=109461 RepID=A0A7M7KT23_VARDE|nr:elongation of very long chain fatty acids protein 4-like [Varroa destructor]XP_022700705.1 elongation of very long chain fatty acids protein 4-like [Varroa jacobsoni]XP_022700706.1 elongation of very long chain fatty acids protein 4-like [Varroa jacobsoni]
MSLARYVPPQDARTADWLGHGNWRLLFYILGLYIGIVKVLLPQYMINRKEYKLLGVIRTYNFLLIIVNVFFLYNLGTKTYFGGGYSWFCQGLDRTNPDLSILRINYSYMFVRMFEFLDTVFFVLRKKYSQVTFLHVSHHCLAIILPWCGIQYGIDGQACLMVVFNMTEQILMYTYYFLSSFPFFRPYLGWKRYLTLFQIVQFAVIGIHMTLPLLYDCNYPILNSLTVVTAFVYFFLMFLVFYLSTYRKRSLSASKCSLELQEIDQSRKIT